MIAIGLPPQWRLQSTMRVHLSCAVLLTAFASLLLAAEEKGFTNLFTEDGTPSGWLVRRWNDLKLPADPGVVWKVQDGILHGSEPRGTWLVSEKEYGDFILEFDWRLGDQGNSGVALRAPLAGDPAFDALEVQMADPRYTSGMLPAELSGALYRAVAPRKQVFKPNDWNHYQITCQGPAVKVILNAELIQDVNLETQVSAAKRHDGTDALPLKERPRKGRIGFQELSRGGGHVEIRNARIQELP
jgi:hypothetical protein